MCSEGAVTRHPIRVASFKEQWLKERPQEKQEEMTKD